MVRNILIFGASESGKIALAKVKDKANVVGFLDNDKGKWGKIIEGVPVLGNKDVLSKEEYDAIDEIIIASMTGMAHIREELLSIGVASQKINTSYFTTQVGARRNFLYDYARMLGERARGRAVAEGGVFQGEFAKEINQAFPDSKFYLFDTFGEGFDEKDIHKERVNGFSDTREGEFNMTSVELVRKMLPHPDKAIFRKGYFPDTARGLEDERYVFVNLDFDLYQPMLEGLRYFYPRILGGGVCLLHDYFNPRYGGVPEAVKAYEQEIGGELVKLPIGDSISLAIMKLQA